MTQDVIILAPGSRARLIVTQGRIGPDLTLCDVSNPMHVVNDDGSEGKMNLKPQYLIFHWFRTEAMMRDYFKGLVEEAVEEARAEEARISLIEIDRAVVAAAEAAREEEREACAKIAIDESARYAESGQIAKTVMLILQTVAAKIRARPSTMIDNNSRPPH